MNVNDYLERMELQEIMNQRENGYLLVRLKLKGSKTSKEAYDLEKKVLHNLEERTLRKVYTFDSTAGGSNRYSLHFLIKQGFKQSSTENNLIEIEEQLGVKLEYVGLFV